MATFLLPTPTGIEVGFEVLVTGGGAENWLELLPALGPTLAVELAEVASLAQAQIASAIATIQAAGDFSPLAEALGLPAYSTVLETRIDTDGWLAALGGDLSLPLSHQFYAPVPVLEIFGGTRIFSVEIAAVELAEGSLKTFFTQLFTGEVLVTALFMLSIPSLGAEAFDNYLDAQAHRQAIEMTIGKTQCRSEFRFKINYDEVRALAARELDWQKPPRFEDPRLTVCRLQYALYLAGESPGAFDGEMGPMTRDALHRFMVKQNLKAHPPHSPVVLGQLALVAAKAKIGDRT